MGNPQLPALRGADDQHEQHGALLGAVRVASIAVGQQLDINYTQDIPFLKRYRGTITAYVYNVSNQQTGYAIQPNFNAANYGQPETSTSRAGSSC